MAALPPGEHVIVGTLSGLEPKTNGWMRFSITREGNQYPDKVDTSKPEIIAQATALMGQLVSAQVNVQQSDTPNPHKPGTFYMNRYLNAIGPAAPGQQSQVAQAAPQAQTPYVPTPQAAPSGDPFAPDARDLKIYRQVAWKTSIDLAVHGLIPFEPVALVQASEVAMGYLRYGPARFGVVGHDAPSANQAMPQGQGDGHEQAPHPADDDIPFAFLDIYEVDGYRRERECPTRTTAKLHLW